VQTHALCKKFSTDAIVHRRMVSAAEIDRSVARFFMSTGLPRISPARKNALLNRAFLQ
jgi:hypothetical protein